MKFNADHHCGQMPLASPKKFQIMLQEEYQITKVVLKFCAFRLLQNVWKHTGDVFYGKVKWRKRSDVISFYLVE